MPSPLIIVMVVAFVLPLSAGILEEIETGNVAGFQHAGSVSEIVCHPDGKHVLSSSRDQCARFWELKTGKLVRRFTAPACGDMWGIRILQGGKEFLAATSSGSIYRFEIATGKVLMTYKHPGTAYRIALMPDGEHFIGTDGKNNAILWKVLSGEKVKSFSGHTADVYTAIVTQNGKTLVTGSDDKSIKQWDVETGKCLKTLKGKTPYGDVYTLARSPDQKRFAMVSGDDFLRVFDAVSLDEIWKTKMGKEGEVVAWSPDGKTIASSSEDKNLYLFDADKGKVIRKIKVADRHHTPIAFSQDGEVLISGGDYHLHLHEVSSGKRMTPEAGIPKKNFSYDHVAVSPKGEQLYLADNSGWEVRDRTYPARNQTFNERYTVSSMTLSPDGGLIAIGDAKGNVKIRETESFTTKVTFKAADAVKAFVFHPDGKTVVTAGEDKVITLWNIKSGEKIYEFRGHSKEIHSMVLAADGDYLYTASLDGSVRVWSISDRSQKAKYFTGKSRPDSVAVFDNGRSVVVAIGEKDAWGKLLPPVKPRAEMKMEEIENLAAGLAEDNFEKRQASMIELATYGERVLPMLAGLNSRNPEVRKRIRSVPDVLRGLFPVKPLSKISEFEEEFSGLAADPQGLLWAGVLGEEGASRLLIGDVNPKDVSLRRLETADLGHGVKKAVFSPDGGHIGTVNTDGSYTLFKVNRP